MIENIELYPFDNPIRLPVYAEHVCDFTGITATGSAVQMWAPIEPRNSAFVVRKKNPAFVKISVASPSSSWGSDLPGAAIHAPAEILPDESILTGVFRENLNDYTAPNVRISNRNGAIKTNLHIGEAMHIQVDRQGRIWAGYSDEGIYSGRSPIGMAGLICFDAEGRVQWEFEPLAGLDPISECYVLNCTDDAVWACYYTDFPIVRIDSEFKITAWCTDLSGPTQMAVKGSRLLVYGGYGDNATDCWLVHLADSTATRIAKVCLRLPGEIALHKATVVGRGEFLHVFVDDLWYRFGVPEDH